MNLTTKVATGEIDVWPDVHSAARHARRHRLWHSNSTIPLIVLNAAAAFFCTLAAFHFSPSAANYRTVEAHAHPIPAALLFAASSVIVSYALGLGYYPNLRSRFRILALTVLLGLLAMGTTLVVSSLIFYKQIGRYIIIIDTLSFILIVASLHLAWFHRMSLSVHRLVIWGGDRFVQGFDDFLRDASFPVKVVGCFEPTSPNRDLLKQMVLRGEVHEVVVDTPASPDQTYLLAALDSGVAVSSATTFVERNFLRTPVSLVSPNWFFDVDFKQHHPFYEPTKRIMDVSIAAIGGFVALPVLLVAAILIKLGSRGPVFYSQVRIGLRQRPFRIWKLRTMAVDSEKAGPQWAKHSDPRVTWVGRILRRTRIDEIPQFWNILRGEMAFVGPRPERPEFVEQLALSIPFYKQRHLTKPGLTGWAQICYPYGACEKDALEKLSYDLYYLKNASFLLDIQILMQTLGAMAKGAR